MIDDDTTIGQPVSPRNTLHFITTGVSNIFWSHVESSNFTSNRRVSERCRVSLRAVSSGLASGDILPFHFVDASGKTPSGLIRATMTALGDFDQCLAIDGTIQGLSMKGKYCAVDLFPVRVASSNDRKSSDTMTTGKLTLDRIALFQRTPFFHSLCIPDHCSQSDLKQILSVGELV